MRQVDKSGQSGGISKKDQSGVAEMAKDEVHKPTGGHNEGCASIEESATMMDQATNRHPLPVLRTLCEFRWQFRPCRSSKWRHLKDARGSKS